MNNEQLSSQQGRAVIRKPVSQAESLNSIMADS